MTTIKPVLRRIHSPDIQDIQSAKIDEEEPFCALIQAFYGPDGGRGDEAFDFLVCNALWISKAAEIAPLSGRHHLIVKNFNRLQLQEFFNGLEQICTGRDWEEVARKLGRFGKWEFEDYVG